MNILLIAAAMAGVLIGWAFILAKIHDDRDRGHPYDVPQRDHYVDDILQEGDE